MYFSISCFDTVG